jgi:glycosyltransferase involved in cell wall biosynthesis
MKVLISAYACEPNKGSEPGVGWNWARQISKFHEVLVITRSNNRGVIEKELSNLPNKNLSFCYVDLPRWLTFWKRGQKGIYCYYYLWQIRAYQVAKKLHAEHRFDLVHHITFVIDWMPSFMHLLHIPFIWGPIGSNTPLPREYRKQLKLMVRIKDKSLNLTKSAFKNFDPILKACRASATKIIAINKEVAGLLPERYQNKVVIYPAIGVDPKNISPVSNIDLPNGLTIMTSGDLRYIKGFNLSISSFHEFIRRGNEGVLRIIGSGKDEKELKRLVRKLGLHEKVVFEPRLPQSEFFRKLRDIDLFLFPTLEGGGMVVLEAMSCSKPVVCLDYGGPGQMVNDSCGIKIPIGRGVNIIESLADGLEKLSSSSELRYQMGIQGRRRAKDIFSWQQKGNWTNRLYQEIAKNKES